MFRVNIDDIIVRGYFDNIETVNSKIKVIDLDDPFIVIVSLSGFNCILGKTKTVISEDILDGFSSDCINLQWYFSLKRKFQGIGSKDELKIRLDIEGKRISNVSNQSKMDM